MAGELGRGLGLVVMVMMGRTGGGVEASAGMRARMGLF